MSEMAKKRIGIIGCGNMGSVITQRTKTLYEVIVFDKDENKTKNLSGLTVINSLNELVDKTDVIILAVKPQDFSNLLAQLTDQIDDKLIVSIAAGLTTAYVENRVNQARVVRVMPNLPARIGKGISCVAKGHFAEEEDVSLVREIFTNLGEVLVVQEEQMNAVTAVTGSGPGFLYHQLKSNNIDLDSPDQIDKFRRSTFTPNLIDAAISVGFLQAQAELLVASMVNGSIELLVTSGSQPEELQAQVTSKGGTTEAGIKILEEGGTLKEAVQAAKKRAEELSK